MWENNGDTRSQYNLTIHSDNTRRPLQDDHYRTMIHVNIHMTIHNWRTLLTLMILMILVTWVIGDNTRRQYKTPVQDDDDSWHNTHGRYTIGEHCCLSCLCCLWWLWWLGYRHDSSHHQQDAKWRSRQQYTIGAHMCVTHISGKRVEQHTVGAHWWQDAVKHDVHWQCQHASLPTTTHQQHKFLGVFLRSQSHCALKGSPSILMQNYPLKPQ